MFLMYMYEFGLSVVTIPHIHAVSISMVIGSISDSPGFNTNFDIFSKLKI
jgi:hypothetical protein